MFIAVHQDKIIQANEFLEKYGANSKKDGITAQCPSCGGNLTLKAAISDAVPVHFSHSKQNSTCPIVSINRIKIPHLGSFETHGESGLKLRRQIANDHELLLNIYIRCNILSNWETGSGNLSVDQFCQLLILSIESKIWNLRETSVLTLPYTLVQLSDYPIQVAGYSTEKTNANQFRFILSPKDKKDKTKAFTNYFLHKNTLTGEFIKGCNIPTPLVERINKSTIDWYRDNIGNKLFERAIKILF